MYILFSYSVMLRCWETKPEERPSFSSLKKIMKEMERKHEVGSFILVAKYVLMIIGLLVVSLDACLLVSFVIIAAN